MLVHLLTSALLFESCRWRETLKQSHRRHHVLARMDEKCRGSPFIGNLLVDLACASASGSAVGAVPKLLGDFRVLLLRLKLCLLKLSLACAELVQPRSRLVPIIPLVRQGGAWRHAGARGFVGTLVVLHIALRVVRHAALPRRVMAPIAGV